MKGDIWVLAEHNGQEVAGVTLEILGEARKLAYQGCKVVAILLGPACGTKMFIIGKS